MKLKSYVLYSYWLKVPDILYMMLLFGSRVVLIFSLITIAYCKARGKRLDYKKWRTILLVALLMIVLTSTGKIAPEMAFNG